MHVSSWRIYDKVSLRQVLALKRIYQYGPGLRRLAERWCGMSEDPPFDEDAPAWPESPFLIALWAELDAASEISIGVDVLQRLDEVQTHCEAAVALIHRWRSQGPLGF